MRRGIVAATRTLRDVHRIGFVLRPGADSWLGGINYLRNLLWAVRAADAPIQPVLFTGPGLDPQALAGFPEIETVVTDTLAAPRLPPLVRTLAAEQARRDTALDAELRRHGIALLSHTVLMGRPRVRAMGWIPDFQHRRLPDQFGVVERRLRDMDFRRVARRSRRVIVSSEDAAADLVCFAPSAAPRCAVLRFAVAPVDAGHDADVVERLGLDRYIHLPNQLWRHKNHAVVVEALGLLASAGSDVTVVCTGDGHDHRAPGNRAALLARAGELGVQDRFRLLGRVSYGDMVALMRKACALVNPSLFEGWSTTVEEGRALGKRMVLSDIAVHREQAPTGATYFPPHDPEALADVLARAWQQDGNAVEPARAAQEARERHRAFGAHYAKLVAETIG